MDKYLKMGKGSRKIHAPGMIHCKGGWNTKVSKMWRWFVSIDIRLHFLQAQAAQQLTKSI